MACQAPLVHCCEAMKMPLTPVNIISSRHCTPEMGTSKIRHFVSTHSSGHARWLSSALCTQSLDSASTPLVRAAMASPASNFGFCVALIGQIPVFGALQLVSTLGNCDGITALPARGTKPTYRPSLLGNPASDCLSRCKIVVVVGRRGRGDGNKPVAQELSRGLLALGLDAKLSAVRIGPLNSTYDVLQGAELDPPATVVSLYGAPNICNVRQLTAAIDTATGVTVTDSNALVEWIIRFQAVLHHHASSGGWFPVRIPLTVPIRAVPSTVRWASVELGRSLAHDLAATPGSGSNASRIRAMVVSMASRDLHATTPARLVAAGVLKACPAGTVSAAEAALGEDNALMLLGLEPLGVGADSCSSASSKCASGKATVFRWQNIIGGLVGGTKRVPWDCVGVGKTCGDDRDDPSLLVAVRCKSRADEVLLVPQTLVREAVAVVPAATRRLGASIASDIVARGLASASLDLSPANSSTAAVTPLYDVHGVGSASWSRCLVDELAFGIFGDAPRCGGSTAAGEVDIDDPSHPLHSKSEDEIRALREASRVRRKQRDRATLQERVRSARALFAPAVPAVPAIPSVPTSAASMPRAELPSGAGRKVRATPGKRPAMRTAGKAAVHALPSKRPSQARGGAVRFNKLSPLQEVGRTRDHGCTTPPCLHTTTASKSKGTSPQSALALAAVGGVPAALSMGIGHPPKQAHTPPSLAPRESAASAESDASSLEWSDDSDGD